LKKCYEKTLFTHSAGLFFGFCALADQPRRRFSQCQSFRRTPSL
jgi:hypothetical protein